MKKGIEGHLGRAGGVDHVEDGAGCEDDPQPPAMGTLLAPIGLPLGVAGDVIACLVGLRDRCGATFFPDRLVKGVEELRDPPESIGDRPRGEMKAVALEILEQSGGGLIGVELVPQEGDPERDPDLALRDQTGSGRCLKSGGSPGTGAGLPEAGAPVDSSKGAHLDLEDLGGLGGSIGGKGGVAMRAECLVRTKRLDLCRLRGCPKSGARTLSSGSGAWLSRSPWEAATFRTWDSFFRPMSPDWAITRSVAPARI